MLVLQYTLLKITWFLTYFIKLKKKNSFTYIVLTKHQTLLLGDLQVLYECI